MALKKVGFAMCGSFCTFSEVIPQISKLAGLGFDIYPIMSEYAYKTDTRFGKAADIIGTIESITGKKIIHTIEQAEPIGPQKLIEALVVAPCTGNTISKLALAITDTPVTMAAKAALRNACPVVIAVSSNDVLSGSSSNLGRLLNTKQYYFVPMRQDDAAKKPASVVADFSLIPETLEAALAGRQLQPVLA